MSGKPFDAMWTAPPPPSHIDTVYINPQDYVVVSAGSGDEAFVHRDCLMDSPVLRLAFRKRVPLNTEDVVVVFIKRDELLTMETALPSTNALDVLPTSEQHLGEARETTIDDKGGESKEDGVDAAAPNADDAPGETAVESAMLSNPRYPVVLKETLQTDNSARVFFPRLDGDQLNVVVSYLYYKHRYNCRPSEEWPKFEVPTMGALAVMRVARALEC
ncbi:hypothetical protein JKF63_03445 [Porcisia hertigi]|uniref:Uncharacterized protein n=1 Tax=Porcisia hertigi TaxID=2761500 RepID=A0A836IQS1_9TRYP|nr:hypothetical protein JKF63_03445 [Porcisia hertigi]